MADTMDNRVTKRYLRNKMKVLSDFGIVDKGNYEKVYDKLAQVPSRYQVDNLAREMIKNKLK
jgi:hypothetical protein